MYSVVIAFLLLKGWKKEINYCSTSKTEDDIKNKYLREANQMRKELSITKPEFERIKENKKITKRGRKNRKPLEKECKTISAETLIEYMERKKSCFRKLKQKFCGRRKQEQSRKINRRFQCDPGQEYAEMKEMVKTNLNEGLLTYKERQGR